MWAARWGGHPWEGILGRGMHTHRNHRGQGARAPQPTACLSSEKGVPVSVPQAGAEASALNIPRWWEGPPAQQASGFNPSAAGQHRLISSLELEEQIS